MTLVTGCLFPVLAAGEEHVRRSGWFLINACLLSGWHNKTTTNAPLTQTQTVHAATHSHRVPGVKKWSWHPNHSQFGTRSHGLGHRTAVTHTLPSMRWGTAPLKHCYSGAQHQHEAGHETQAIHLPHSDFFWIEFSPNANLLKSTNTTQLQLKASWLCLANVI